MNDTITSLAVKDIHPKVGEWLGSHLDAVIVILVAAFAYYRAWSWYRGEVKRLQENHSLVSEFTNECGRIVATIRGCVEAEVDDDAKYHAMEKRVRDQQEIAVRHFRSAQNRLVLIPEIPLNDHAKSDLFIWKDVAEFAITKWPNHAPRIPDNISSHPRADFARLIDHACDLIACVSKHGLSDEAKQ